MLLTLISTLGIAVAAQHYTLNCDAGAYASSGVGAIVRSAYRVPAGSGLYTCLGAASQTTAGRKIQASSFSYAVSGKEATTIVSRSMPATSGAYLSAGSNVVLGVGRNLAGTSGAYNALLNHAALSLSRSLACDRGDYGISWSQARGLHEFSFAPVTSVDISGLTVCKNFFVTVNELTHFIQPLDGTDRRCEITDEVCSTSACDDQDEDETLYLFSSSAEIFIVDTCETLFITSCANEFVALEVAA